MNYERVVLKSAVVLNGEGISVSVLSATLHGPITYDEKRHAFLLAKFPRVGVPAENVVLWTAEVADLLPCPDPDCEQEFETPQGLAAHRSYKHDVKGKTGR